MAYIVLHERRPFDFVDFLSFEVDSNIYKMAYGTIRNELSKLVKSNEIEVCYRSTRTYYTLRGHKFGKPMTVDHSVVHYNDPIYNMFQNLPLDKHSIHDIRLRFSVPGIWTLLSNNQDFNRNKRSQDIAIPSWTRHNVIVRIFIHKTDTVSVILGCSLQPIPLDLNGIIRFFTLLVRVEERLQNILDNHTRTNSNTEYNSIPEYKNWIIAMWHFGREVSVEYAGERFSITVEKLEPLLNRLYVKDIIGKKKIRFEKQEHPRKTVFDSIEEKLGVTNCM